MASAKGNYQFVVDNISLDVSANYKLLIVSFPQPFSLW